MALKKKDTMEVTTAGATTVDTYKANADSTRLDRAKELLSEKFGLGDDYILTGFTDKGSNIKITVSSQEFTVTVLIDRPDLYGFDLPV